MESRSLPIGFVEHLRDMSDDDGKISFETGLGIGDKVVLLGGPFAERIGTILSLDGKGRVKLLLELLSSQVPVETRADNLMPA